VGLRFSRSHVISPGRGRKGRKEKGVTLILITGTPQKSIERTTSLWWKKMGDPNRKGKYVIP